jgi:hypothetical protein
MFRRHSWWYIPSCGQKTYIIVFVVHIPFSVVLVVHFVGIELLLVNPPILVGEKPVPCLNPLFLLTHSVSGRMHQANGA